MSKSIRYQGTRVVVRLYQGDIPIGWTTFYILVVLASCKILLSSFRAEV